ncbi:hypothetical protein RHORCCE3_1908 [Rickettsia hoogstraalii str. RCCE3]|nr:hypothetical protein RHORCCE3_1908 [Rickettsia hoogstraalii str. RCCE3]
MSTCSVLESTADKLIVVSAVFWACCPQNLDAIVLSSFAEYLTSSLIASPLLIDIDRSITFSLSSISTLKASFTILASFPDVPMLKQISFILLPILLF